MLDTILTVAAILVPFLCLIIGGIVKRYEAKNSEQDAEIKEVRKELHALQRASIRITTENGMRETWQNEHDRETGEIDRKLDGISEGVVGLQKDVYYIKQHIGMNGHSKKE